ncbi:MAG: HD domain-containing protein [Clostridiales bacterium]|nr:HD domain-containing protein [Clostridiales bacterium]MCF8023475.1 HD domain-containing protein [Clostridiales bacterium]
MNKEELQYYHNWFASYVKDFYTGNSKTDTAIKLKEEHTYRVCSNINDIGKSLDLAAKDLHMAEAIALFHDIGRFRQFFHYGTYNDARSEDHGELGKQVLDETGILSYLAEDKQEIILEAVRHHNKRCLPESLPDKTLLFLKMVRDADKIDIFEVFCRYYSNSSSELDGILEIGLPDTPGYSKILIKNLLQEQICNFEDVKNSNDKKLLQLSWIYDLNFNFALQEIARRGHIEKLIKTLPDTKEIQEVYSCLQNYINRHSVK